MAGGQKLRNSEIPKYCQLLSYGTEQRKVRDDAAQAQLTRVFHFLQGINHFFFKKPRLGIFSASQTPSYDVALEKEPQLSLSLWNYFHQK